MQRFLDADPSAQLGFDEMERVRAHLARCAGCQGLASQYQELARLLALRGVTAEPAEQDVGRVRAAAMARIDAEHHD
jgi:predicted anti-sigma-YlaC factor YlaD